MMRGRATRSDRFAAREQFALSAKAFDARQAWNAPNLSLYFFA